MPAHAIVSPDDTDAARLGAVFSGEAARLRATPVHRLAEALLLDAAQDACRSDRSARADVESWIAEKHGERRVFSLVWCCAAWGLDESSVRARLVELLAGSRGNPRGKRVKYRPRIVNAPTSARIGSKSKYQADRKRRTVKA